MGKDRRRNTVKANKPSTSKSIDKITYCQKKHKQKFVRMLRLQLRTKNVPSSVQQSSPIRILKFGSWNIDGIEAGTIEAIENLVKQEDLDVRKLRHIH